jgi:UDP-N-acetylmuramate dehydrogenase
MLTVSHHCDLTSLNTLHLQSSAANYLILSDASQLNELHNELKSYTNYLILGGGSNIILPEEYEGLVIHNQLKGILYEDYDDEHVLVTAYGGEIWDNFVAYCCENGSYGLENLSLVPGTVGASPVQNIGAYGVEVKDFIESVNVYDLHSGKFCAFSNLECQFAYRDSMFKRNPHYLVISVTFKLLKFPQLKLNYGDISNALAGITNPTPHELRQAIIQIRQNKLPDPALIGNVGSFFHNPIIAEDIANDLLLKYPKLPIYKTDQAGLVKVSAGWLIDNLGLKGYREGKVGVYAKQALVSCLNLLKTFSNKCKANTDLQLISNR